MARLLPDDWSSMPFNIQDERFMNQALELAREGTALTSPGARVGAVVVEKGGEVAATGFYSYDGVQHAEAVALERAGERARGGTLYVNLEPCAHHGRTPPCAERVIASGVRRVVASMADPNPQVAGKGFAQIRSAGIEVEVGLLEREARRLNESFARYIRDRCPLVTLKSAMTLDGKIASSRGRNQQASASSTFITGTAARTHVQELRHEADALLVGIGTVLADDPLLTDRTSRPRRRPLLRVVLDSHLRLPLDSQLVKTAANDVMVFCGRADEHRQRELMARGVCVEPIEVDASSGRPDLRSVVQRLAQKEIVSLMIEGGSEVNAAALAAGIVDKIFFYYAPAIMGGIAAVPFASGKSLGQLGRLNVSGVSVHRFEADIAVEGYLRDPYVELHPAYAEIQKVVTGERS